MSVAKSKVEMGDYCNPAAAAIEVYAACLAYTEITMVFSEITCEIEMLFLDRKMKFYGACSEPLGR